jgi:hypothetical protein
MSLRYVAASWHRPYGARDEREEWFGFGHDEGEVRGEIEGKLVWANYPAVGRTESGRRTYAGWISTRDESELLVSIHGQSVHEHAPGHHRAILARVELTTEAEQYRWLNTCFLVGEGEIDEERNDLWIETYVCVHEHAQGPSALGVEPPERFRQRATKTART